MLVPCCCRRSWVWYYRDKNGSITPKLSPPPCHICWRGSRAKRHWSHLGHYYTWGEMCYCTFSQPAERERGVGVRMGEWGGGRRSPNKTCCPSLSVTPSYSLSDSHLTVKSSGPDLSVSSTFCRGVLLKLWGYSMLLWIPVQWHKPGCEKNMQWNMWRPALLSLAMWLFESVFFSYVGGVFRQRASAHLMMNFVFIWWCAPRLAWLG